jgi:hypothetical protein
VNSHNEGASTQTNNSSKDIEKSHADLSHLLPYMNLMGKENVRKPTVVNVGNLKLLIFANEVD